MLFRFAKRFFKKNRRRRLLGCGESTNCWESCGKEAMAKDKKTRHFGIDPKTRQIILGKWRIALPDSPALRVVVGLVLIAGGILGFLPILGFWMVPLGLLVLSHDIPAVRRARRKLAVWWTRRRSNAEKSSGK
jgi:hypothetical protein